jgi:excisionase family DNA binding protein
MQKRMAKNEDQLHSVESAAHFLGGISPSTIRVWLWRGRLTRVKVGRRTMIYESELLALIKPELREVGNAR